MSSMLLKPTMRCPPTSIEPKRLEVSTIGSPSVFHTAPPQPASKARMTCSPELVGGALASQNGLGLLMPAKSIERSAMAWGSKDGRDAPARARRLAGRALREPANHSMAAAAGNDGPPRHPMAGARQNAGFPASSSSTASASWNWRFIAAVSR